MLYCLCSELEPGVAQYAMGANQSSTRDEDSCSSDTDDKIAELPKEIRKLAIEEPRATAVAPPSVEGDRAHHLYTSSPDIEVTGLPLKIPKLDEETTPWKGSASKLTSQQSSSSSAHVEEQVSIIHVIILLLMHVTKLPNIRCDRLSVH